MITRGAQLVIDGMNELQRKGKETDEPEGVRFVIVSDTLMRLWVTWLEAGEGPIINLDGNVVGVDDDGG